MYRDNPQHPAKSIRKLATKCLKYAISAELKQPASVGTIPDAQVGVSFSIAAFKWIEIFDP
jgi:hypothetical protein